MTWIAPAAVPLVVGAVVLWFALRNPALRSRPAWTSLLLLPLLITMSWIAAAGSSILGANVGLVASLVVAFAVYVALRLRLASTRNANSS